MSIQEINKNVILSNVLQLLIDQTEKGVKKYGNTVNPDDYSLIEWINHTQQELADAIVYLETTKQKLVEGKR